jgi:hypothetical protein
VHLFLCQLLQAGVAIQCISHGYGMDSDLGSLWRNCVGWVYSFILEDILLKHSDRSRSDFKIAFLLMYSFTQLKLEFRNNLTLLLLEVFFKKSLQLSGKNMGSLPRETCSSQISRTSCFPSRFQCPQGVRKIGSPLSYLSSPGLTFSWSGTCPVPLTSRFQRES